MLARAALALKARHAALEHAARQELPELALDELREAHAIARLHRRAQEGLQMLGDNLMENGVLGVSRAIHGLGTRHPSGYRASSGAPMPRDGYTRSLRVRNRPAKYRWEKSRSAWGSLLTRRYASKTAVEHERCALANRGASILELIASTPPTSATTSFSCYRGDAAPSMVATRRDIGGLNSRRIDARISGGYK